METLHNGFTLQICPGSFPLSTDSMALADFSRLPANARVLDLGSGCGTLGLLLCAKDPTCQVTGVEITPCAHEAALENISRNRIQTRLNSICDDLCRVPELVRPGSFDICISNPPYFSGGIRSKTNATARSESYCTLEDLFQSAAWALRYGGDFYLVHRPERLSEIFVGACARGLEPKRLCLLRHSKDTPVSVVLLQLRKGGKPGLLWDELILHNPDGTPSEDYRRIYHLQEDA